MGIRSFAAELLLPAALGQRMRAAAGKPAAPADPVGSFAALSEKLGYLGKAEQRQVREAYRFADEAHLGQFRASKEPYITHPLSVAGIAADWHLDVQALMAALLHDVMEDCGVSKSTLIERFGAPTAELVDGLTKLDKLQFASRVEGQAASFRKMLLAMTRDVRVIMIKLADRLHNMRTLEAMKPASRARIARETLDIYAPIAHRLGLNSVYRELQDLGFTALHPWRSAVLAKAMAHARGNRRDLIGSVERDVVKAFARAKLKMRMASREKTVYSVYRKMRERRAGFADVTDIFGFRLLMPTLMDCYTALGTLHQLYKPVPGRFKDYIAIPKANGYQSLHTTLLSPLGSPVEFQMRTDAMHAVAETGIAAHWLYKNKGADAGEAQRLGAMWLKSLVDIQDDTRDSAEFLEHVKIDLVPEEIYVFTPKGKILRLQRGATALDFAYAIHSDVGDHAAQARIDGVESPLRTELANGNVVEIELRDDARPHPSWLAYVRTARARAKIRHTLKTAAAGESRALGLRMLAQAVRAEGLSMPALDADDAGAQQVWAQLLRASGARSIDDLLVDLGVGKRIVSLVGKRMAQLLIESGQRPDALTLTIGRFGVDGEGDATGRSTAAWIDGSEGASVQMAPCCLPIPGDAILGHLRGDALVVHTSDCPVGRRIADRDPERLMPIEWSDQPVRPFDSLVRLVVSNHKGALAQIAMAVSSAEADITHLAMDEDDGGETVEIKLRLAVRDRQHLADVLRALRRAAVVRRANRVRPAPTRVGGSQLAMESG